MGGPQGALSSEGRDAALLCGCRVAVGLKKIDRVGDWSDVPVLCSPTPRAPSLEAPPSDTTWGSGLGPAVCGCSWELPSPVTSVPWKLLLLLLLTELYIFSFEFKSFKKL